jgi:hypothetical protein
MRANPFPLLAAIAVLGAADVRPASAQAPTPNPTPSQTPTTISERPYRGLFGGGVGDVRQLLTASGSVGGGYDDNILTDARSLGHSGNVRPEAAKAGMLGSFQAAIAYTLSGDRSALNASVAASSRYYPDLTPNNISGYRAALGGSRRLGSHTTLGAGGGVSYLPFRLTGVFPDTFDGEEPVEVLPDLDLTASLEAFWMRRAYARASHDLTPRSSLTATVSHRSSQSARWTEGLAHERVNLAYRYSVARGLALRGAWGYAKWHKAEEYRSGNQLFDGGLDFNRALSFSRRTMLSFGTGMTALDHYGQPDYRWSGSTRLDHDIGRTWKAMLGYHRGLRHIDTLADPIFSNSLRASVGGLVSRRLQVSTDAWASIGDAGFSEGDKRFDTYAGAVSVSYALTRYVGIGVRYARYYYHFDPAVVLPPGVPHDIDRQSLRAEVDLWAPLFLRARRSDVAR